MSRLGTRLTAAWLVGVGLQLATGQAAWGKMSLGEPRLLLSGSDNVEKPAVSPDGTRVAYVSDRGGAENLWVVELQGGEPVRITAETRPEVQVSSPRWSPRGDFLVYTSNKGETGSFDLWLIGADGRGDEALTHDASLDWMPAWSPDGRTIAFVSDRDGSDGLWLIGTDGSGARKLASLAYEPAWSPDGQRLAAYHIEAQTDGLFVLDPAGREAPRLVLEGGRMPCWSPDGRYLVAVKSDETGERLWLADLQRDAHEPLGPATDGLGWPSWGAHGPVVVYEASRAGGKRILVAGLLESRPMAALTEPVAGASVRGPVTVRGRISGDGGAVAGWRLEYGQGASPRQWKLAAEGSGAVDGELTTWRTSGLEGVYTLRLTAVAESGETAVAAVPVTVFGQYGIQWDQHGLPVTMLAGNEYSAEVRVRNIGTMTWRRDGQFAVYGSYQWIDSDGQVVVAEGWRSELPRSVDAEDTVAFKARIEAPAKPGTYVLRYDLRQGGQVWFHEQGAQPLELTVSVAQAFAYQVDIPSPPAAMVPGQIYSVEVKLLNRGALTWKGLSGAASPGADTVRLVSRWRDLSGGLVDSAPLELPLPSNVPPGEALALTTQVQAPAVNGRYLLSFDLRDEQGLFSDRMGRQPGGAPVEVSSPYGVEFLTHNTPGRLFPGEIRAINLQARNTGSLKWRADGPQPIRVTYRWIDRLGNELRLPAIPSELPYDALPGMAAAVTARLQAPGEAGEYTLLWDLEQAGGRRFGELGNLPLKVSVMVGAPTHAVRWEQLQHPVEMVVGSLYTVELRLTNQGAMTWSPEGRDGVRLGYHWVRPNGEELFRAPLFTDLPKPVDQGQSVRLTARVQAPDRAGRYMLKWDLYQGGYDFFSTRGAATLDIPVDVQVIYGAEFLSHDTPTRLVAGQRYRVNLRVKNTGTIPWEAGGNVPVQLSYRWYNAAGDQVALDKQLRSPLSRTIQAGESLEIAAYLDAPAQPGRYDLEWDLLFASSFWFTEKGVQPLRVPVTVE